MLESHGPICKRLSSDYRKINRKSVVSSPFVILYDLSCSYRNYVSTLSCDNPNDKCYREMIVRYCLNQATGFNQSSYSTLGPDTTTTSLLLLLGLLRWV